MSINMKYYPAICKIYFEFFLRFWCEKGLAPKHCNKFCKLAMCAGTPFV